jgi:hypothetical protein
MIQRLREGTEIAIAPASASERERAPLTDDQRRIVEHGDGPLVVIAGAGTGKTRVIVERVRYLLETHEDLLPEQLLVLTYNVKAARELRERIQAAVGPTTAARITVSNYHSFCQGVLTETSAEADLPPHPDVVDGIGQLLLLKELRPQLGLVYHTPYAFPEFVKFINRCKDELVTPADFDAFVANERAIFEGRHGNYADVAARLATAGYLKPMREVRKDYARLRTVERSDADGEELEVIEQAVEKTADREARRNVDASGRARSRGGFEEDQQPQIDQLAGSYLVDGAALEVMRLTELASVYHAYQDALAERGALDFGEQVAAVTHLFKQRPNILRRYQRQFRYILVDEFQDANIAQFIAEVRSASDVLSKQLAEKQEATRASLAAEVAPLTDVIDRWRKKHDAWEAEISKRREQLKEVGLTLEVEHLERIRARLVVIEGEVRKFIAQEATHMTARGERKNLVADLETVRVKRHQIREAISDQLVAAVNRGQSTLVSVKWRRSAQLDEYGSRLGQLFNLRSPRSERLAAVVDPHTLAGIGWRNDVAALAALRDGAEPFLADPTAAMDLLRTYDVLFELEAFLVEDRPEIRVRFRGDPTGPGRLLGELSLGQVRSILLGFLLSSPGNAPLILDQPEDQLDGPFLADTVVGYLHAAKERRQVLVATHNPNVVVLGDAELVLPLRGESGHGEVVDQGSVDATATRAQVLRLLEGGPAAFEERGRRYGYRVERLPS